MATMSKTIEQSIREIAEALSPTKSNLSDPVVRAVTVKLWIEELEKELKDTREALNEVIEKKGIDYVNEKYGSLAKFRQTTRKKYDYEDDEAWLNVMEEYEEVKGKLKGVEKAYQLRNEPYEETTSVTIIPNRGGGKK
jgi:Fe-S-cluster formation regulator IscX/YfhJ